LEPTDHTVAVLFADVSGSTQLYEQLGDAKALATMSRCLDMARDSATSYGGRLVKTIGDEVMIVFPTADMAAIAAVDIQEKMLALAHTEQLRLAFRIGFHFGGAIERDGDVFGDSVNTAARLVGLAKAGQIITSDATAKTLPAYLRSQLRELDVATVKGKQQDIGLVELLWHMTADLTTVAPRPLVQAAELELRHGDATIRLTAQTSAITLGRDPQNDLVINDRRASRLHARIERRRDKFALIDASVNGTYVTIDGDREFLVHRQELLLQGKGRMSFGHAYESDPETVFFACVDN
jgi:class 3 adenylate cyclase